MNKILKFLKDLWDKPDIYWKDLNTNTENEKENKAKKEIIEYIPLFLFACTSFITLQILIKIEGIEDLQGSAYIFLIYSLVFMLLVFVTVHTKNSRKRLN
jgi:hypothetical protein